MIVDGTGARRFTADLLLEDDRIAAIGRAEGAPADRSIDASGKIVCPGFVDIHSHADLSICKPEHNRILAPLVEQGITTFVGGNCGVGLAPLDKERHLNEQTLYLEGITAIDFGEMFVWEGVGDYLEYLEDLGVALNVGLLCPHGLIRIQVMGSRRAAATADEVYQMGHILDRAMEEGAFGLSTGLQYFPGMSATTDELVALGKVLARFDGSFTSHMRSYTTNTMFRAIDEVVEVARRNDIRAQVSHIYSAPWLGRLQNPFMSGVRLLSRHPRIAKALIPETLANAFLSKMMTTLDERNASGIRLGMDVVPATTGFTHLLAFMPPWLLEGVKEDVLARAANPDVRRRLRRDIEQGAPIWPHRGDDDWSLNIIRIMGYEAVRIMAVGSDRNRRLQGLRLVDIAEEYGKHPVDAAMDLTVEEEGKVLVYATPGEPDDPFTVRSLFPAMRHPRVAITTDFVMMGYGRPAWLFHGCFPKFIGAYARDGELVSLEAAIRKCTSLPASAIGLSDRGLLEEGAFADVVVFDPTTIGSSADFANPDRPPVGVEHVFINGTHVVRDGVYDENARAGQVLRHG